MSEIFGANRCYMQIIWMEHQLSDYEVYLRVVSIKCDKISAINLTKTPLLHSQTEYIEIRHHFIIYHVEKGGFCNGACVFVKSSGRHFYYISF